MFRKMLSIAVVIALSLGAASAALAQSGVEAPGVIHTITAIGTPDVSGATMHAIAVTYRPTGGDPIETTIEQSLLPFQVEGMAEGKPCTVKYDPDMPTSAVLQSW